MNRYKKNRPWGAALLYNVRMKRLFTSEHIKQAYLENTILKCLS